MKTFKGIIYGLSICWLVFVSVNYLIAVAYSGLEDIVDCSLDGVALFVTMLSVIITVIRYPVKQLVTKWIREIDKHFKQSKAHGIKTVKGNKKAA